MQVSLGFEMVLQIGKDRRMIFGNISIAIVSVSTRRRFLNESFELFYLFAHDGFSKSLFTSFCYYSEISRHIRAKIHGGPGF